MAKITLFKETFDARNLDEIGDLIKQSKVLSAAVKSNPALAFSLANAAQKVAGAKDLTEKMLSQIIKADSQLAIASKNTAFKNALVDFLKAVIKGKLTSKPTGKPDNPANSEEGEDDGTLDDEAAEDLSLKILTLINDIPIAHPGDIITSEHHNLLRRAIKALAALIGDADISSIQTFAPYFLPLDFPKPGDDRSEHDWKLLYNKAVVPTVSEQGGAGGVVKGGMLVRLPDGVLIKTMIVRGKRLDEDADDPKSFNVALSRIEADKINAQPAVLIKHDLKDATGTFKKSETPTSSVRIDNAKYNYYVTAVWEDDDDSSGFEIRSIQFFCER